MNDVSEPDATASPPKQIGRRRRAMIWRFFGATLAAFALVIGAAVPAAAAELMRVTFVRHGESAGNASGLIDTSTPGPVLTPKGQQQAQDVVDTLGDNNYDAIYASTMVRTQLTAAPMSQYLRLPIQVLPGLQEIEAGVFEGTPESQAQGGYGLYPLGWTFPGVIPQIPVEYFNMGTKMPGTELDGYAFDARVDGALKTMYDNGDRNAVVFSHGGAIMFWTMMNVNNLTVQDKLQLLQTAKLDNTDHVVIEGNSEDGWTLVNWNGQQFSPEPTLHAAVKLQFRTLKGQLAATAKQISEAFATRDFATIATAINRGVADATYSIVKFHRAVNARVIQELDKVFGSDYSAPSVSAVSPLKAAADTGTAAAKVESTADTVVAAAKVESTTDSVAGDATRRNKSGADAVKSLKADAPVADPTPIAAPKPEPVEASGTPEASEASETDVASNGATDLKDGNKTVPGEPKTRPARRGHRLPDALKDVSDRGTAAVQTPGDSAHKEKVARASKSGTSGDAGAAGSRGGGRQQSDAA